MIQLFFRRAVGIHVRGVSLRFGLLCLADLLLQVVDTAAG